jgi:beta-xylosidase
VIESVMLWNEPNNLSHWDRDLDPNWERFSAMVRNAGKRIGAVAPGLVRVLGGISPIDPAFVANLMAQGIGEAVDVVAVHGFPFDWNRWHVSAWGEQVDAVRAAAGGRPVWATEVGVSSLAARGLQRWAVDATLEALLPHVQRVYWYALMDLPDSWEAVTRHRENEGTAYFRHFRMGLYDAVGREKPGAGAFREWARRSRSPATLTSDGTGLGVCEWTYWREEVRLARTVALLRELGIRRLRTGIGWADWWRPGAREWFDHVMTALSEFELLVTLCFTPVHLGLRPHHTSPPADPQSFADFCEDVVLRYVASAPQARSGEVATSTSS